MPSDNLSHWSDIFMWRHHHYQAIVAAYESQAQHEQVCLSYLQICTWLTSFALLILLSLLLSFHKGFKSYLNQLLLSQCPS